jgi:hypothetical protein
MRFSSPPMALNKEVEKNSADFSLVLRRIQ